MRNFAGWGMFSLIAKIEESSVDTGSGVEKKMNRNLVSHPWPVPMAEAHHIIYLCIIICINMYVYIYI